MKAVDVMTRRVISVRPEASVKDAVVLMLKNAVSGVFVIDAQKQLAGIVTEGDLLRRAEIGTERRRLRWIEFLVGSGAVAEDYTRSHARKVRDIMAREVVTVGEDANLADTVRLMEQKRIKRVPVLRGTEVIGVVSRANLLQALAMAGIEQSASSESDPVLRERILARLDNESWAPKGFINPIVRNGVVELWGTILDERERAALRIAAENTPGVKAVHDRLVWVEPYSGFTVEAPEASDGDARASAA
jgi:CBS domain-containing protein